MPKAYINSPKNFPRKIFITHFLHAVRYSMNTKKNPSRINTHPLQLLKNMMTIQKVSFVEFSHNFDMLSIKCSPSNIEKCWKLFFIVKLPHRIQARTPCIIFHFIHPHSLFKVRSLILHPPVNCHTFNHLPLSLQPPKMSLTSTNCFVVNFTAIDNNNECASEWERKWNLRLVIQTFFPLLLTSSKHSNQYI